MKVGNKVFRKAEYVDAYSMGINYCFDPSKQYEIEGIQDYFLQLSGVPGSWAIACFYPARNAATFPQPAVENPKTGAGRCKVPLECNPPIASAYQALAHENGALKYGERNWRDSEVPSMTYAGAIARHWALYLDGEDIDPESGLPHLAHIMASCAIILDAKAHGTLNDNRPTAGKANEEFKKIQESLPALRALWAEKRGEVQK